MRLWSIHQTLLYRGGNVIDIFMSRRLSPLYTAFPTPLVAPHKHILTASCLNSFYYIETLFSDAASHSINITTSLQAAHIHRELTAYLPTSIYCRSITPCMLVGSPRSCCPVQIRTKGDNPHLSILNTDRQMTEKKFWA